MFGVAGGEECLSLMYFRIGNKWIQRVGSRMDGSKAWCGGGGEVWAGN